MKKTDIALIVLIASVSVLVAYFVAQATPLGNSSNEPVTIKSIERIEVDVTEPDSRIFNSGAINPSVEVQISPTEVTGSQGNNDSNPSSVDAGDS